MCTTPNYAYFQNYHVTFGGSGGIRSTARPEVPYPCDSQAKSRDETSRRGSNVTVRSHGYIYIGMQIPNSVVCDASKGCICKQIKPPLVGEHAFPLTGFVCQSAHVTIASCKHVREMNTVPFIPLLYSKIGVYRGIHFSYICSKT